MTTQTTDLEELKRVALAIVEDDQSVVWNAADFARSVLSLLDRLSKAEGERDYWRDYAEHTMEVERGNFKSTARRECDAAELRASKAEERARDAEHRAELAEAAAAAMAEQRDTAEEQRKADKARLDWLEHHLVEVREPLVNGSLHLFFARPDDSFEGEEGPSDLRAKIDAAIHQTGGADAQS
jgi:hypothetical protein